MPTPTTLASPAAAGPQMLADQARTLCRAARAGRLAPLLRGTYLGLVTEDPGSPEAALFASAAGELGAQVATIRPSVAGIGDGDLDNTARWLGRLYQAVECQGLSPELVAGIRAAAGIPVLDGAASASHPSAALAPTLDAAIDPVDARRRILQAMLLHTLR